MIPNILTTVRLAIIPVFAFFMISKENYLVGALLFFVSGLTDIVDGWIARKFNMITDIGSVYDPLVDKLMQITAVVCLAFKSIIPAWIIYIVAAKEISMIVIGIVCYINNKVLKSNWYGKTATVLFYTVVLILMVFQDINYIFKTTMLILLVAVMLFAALGYLIKFAGEGSKDILKEKM